MDPPVPVVVSGGQPEGQGTESENVRPRKMTKQNKEDSFVSFSDVLSFIGNRDASIEPYVGENGDTLLYIVNYPNGTGWKIISSDRRTPAVSMNNSRSPGEPGHWEVTTTSEIEVYDTLIYQ